MRLLGGVERRVRRGRKTRSEGEEEEEKELGWKEVKKILENLKDGKAMGMDELSNEVWKYGGERMERWAWEVCKRVWNGWPEEWKERVIIPILKKGKGELVKEYKGVILMPSLYKVYAAVLAGSLEDDLERKRILSETQAGFRKGMGTLNQTYALNYIINRQIGRKAEKLTAVFIDLKAAFDSVDKKVLIEVMRERV